MASAAVGYGTSLLTTNSRVLHLPVTAPPHGAAAAPVVDWRALSREGDLAFISRAELYVLDGANGHLTDVAGPGRSPSDPVFSPDRRWLLYETAQSETSWLAAADGRGPRALGGLASWLADGELAIDRGGVVSAWSLGTTGDLRRRGGAGAVASPGPGGYLFVTDTLRVNPPRSSSGVVRIETARSPTGPRTLWYQAPVGFNAEEGLHGTFIGPVTVLLGEEGLVFPIDSSCCDDADGHRLYELRSPGGRPQFLGVVLTSSETPSLGPNATFAIGAGGDRYAWASKHVEQCDARTARCSEVPTPAGELSLSPAWSPDRSTLAYVEADAEPEGSIGQPQILSWYATHHLELWSAGSKKSVEVERTTGAASPIWSADSRRLLFVGGDALYLTADRGANPVEVAGPLFDPGHWNAYYGEIDWTSQFAWSAA